MLFFIYKSATPQSLKLSFFEAISQSSGKAPDWVSLVSG